MGEEIDLKPEEKYWSVWRHCIGSKNLHGYGVTCYGQHWQRLISKKQNSASSRESYSTILLFGRYRDDIPKEGQRGSDWTQIEHQRPPSIDLDRERHLSGRGEDGDDGVYLRPCSILIAPLESVIETSGAWQGDLIQTLSVPLIILLPKGSTCKPEHHFTRP